MDERQACDGKAGGDASSLLRRGAAHVRRHRLVDLQACTVTGCSSASASDELFLYPPDQPVVDSLAPPDRARRGRHEREGRRAGPRVSARRPLRGNEGAILHRSSRAQLACGSTSELRAVSPPGKAGKSVPVTVTTWESYFTGTGDAPSQARFSYTGH
jgi:hypothetical protein